MNFSYSPSPWPACLQYGKWLVALCLAPVVLMFFGIDFSSPSNGQGETIIHSLLEWSGVCAAIIVGTLAFLQYRLTDEPSLPIIGLAVLGAAGMDIFHTLAASGLVASITDLDSFIPYTWVGSRLFGGLISITGVGLFVIWKAPHSRIRGATLLLIAATFIGAAVLLMNYCATSAGLPRTIYADNLILRPLDLYPLGVFLVAAVLVFPAYYRHNPTPFALALILSMIPHCATQLYMAFGSASLHDSAFNVAHGMKALGYLVPAGGLLAELFLMFRKEQEMRRRFEHARSHAQSATRSKSEFLASITQEIRTPMTGVVGMTDLLLASNLTEQQQDAANIISGSASAVLALVEDVQDFSRLENGTAELESKPLEPRRLMDGLLDLMTTQAAEHHVRLGGFVAPEVPQRVIGDIGRLRQILIKLTTNALRHTRDGEVNLMIEMVENEAHFVVLRIHVRDTGAGMAEDKRAQILNSFALPGQDDGHDFGGNGLGLAVTRQFVRLMGGSIWVESKLGEGTSFCFTIRAGKDVEPSVQEHVPDDWKGQRVLIAASSDARAQHLQLQLSAWGFEVITVNDGCDSIRELRAAAILGTPFKAAIFDDDLTGQSGLELCHQVRESKNGDSIKLLLISNLSDLPIADSILRRSYDLRLQSPITHSGLHNVMQQLYGIDSSPIFRRNAASEDPLSVQENGLNVLIAEDDPTSQKVLAKMLESLHCKVSLADNGHEAAEKIQANSYDLVFMDCQMPHMDGHQATRLTRVREAQSGNHTIIIGMTANARLTTRELCLESGMDDYMPKPIGTKDLAVTLERWKAEEALAFIEAL